MYLTALEPPSADYTPPSRNLYATVSLRAPPPRPPRPLVRAMAATSSPSAASHGFSPYRRVQMIASFSALFHRTLLGLASQHDLVEPGLFGVVKSSSPRATVPWLHLLDVPPSPPLVSPLLQQRGARIPGTDSPVAEADAYARCQIIRLDRPVKHCAASSPTQVDNQTPPNPSSFSFSFSIVTLLPGRGPSLFPPPAPRHRRRAISSVAAPSSPSSSPRVPPRVRVENFDRAVR
ncbi:hypothetical protein B0H13DRAFT_2659825 [Mycena leptocephala]|nr:hypothetical protein B0H13DRAFT_2659825 [Mycena leptocephala]